MSNGLYRKLGPQDKCLSNVRETVHSAIQAVFYVVFDPVNYLYFKALYRGLWLFTSRCSAKW